MENIQFQRMVELYPQTCKFLKLKHHLPSSFEKNIIESMMQYLKDRPESFDVYFPCRKKKCKLKHTKQWFSLFSDPYNKETIS
ncbi:MAG TPA: hypothetical protein VIY08_06915 [Candidatus Nitrosocosmicus sp.]